MNAQQDHSAANLARVAPILDEAINLLGAQDRAAILLRFFEQRDLRSVGEALGSSEYAAQKHSRTSEACGSSLSTANQPLMFRRKTRRDETSRPAFLASLFL